MSESEHKPATSVAELDLHFRYQRRDMATLLDRLDAMNRVLATMATKSDMEELKGQMRDFVRRSEFDELSRSFKEANVGKTFWRAVDAVTKLGGAIIVMVALGGLVAAFVHFADKVK